MSNFEGTSRAILQRKAQDIVKTVSRQYHAELINKMLNLILLSIDNPAYQAAMITALRSSDTLEKIVNEIQNPSFIIPGVDYIDPDDKPAKYTTDYQAVQEFLVNEDIRVIPTNPTPTQMDVMVINKDHQVFSRIVLPK